MFIWFYNVMPTMGFRPTLVSEFVMKEPSVKRAIADSKFASHNVPLPAQSVLLSTFMPMVGMVKPSSLRPTSVGIKFISADSNLVPSFPSLPSNGQTAAAKFVPGAIASPLPWDQKVVNLNLSSTAIETVVSIISKQTGVNVVLMAKPDQKVTINVSQMPIGDALKHLAMLAGLRTVRVKNAVVMADEVTLKGAYPKEFESEYGNVVKAIDPSTSSQGSKTEPSKIEVQDNVKRIHILKYQGAMQVVNSLKEYLLTQKVTIVALPNTLLPNLGATGSSGFSNSGGATTSTTTIDSRAKQVLLSGPVAAVQEAILVLQQMDIPRRQVEITVTIHDVANDALRDAGVTWDLGQTTVSEAVNGNANVGTFSRTGLSFVGTLKALETASKAKLLASPNISVMDGELGSILIGEKRRFPVVTGTTASGQFIYSTEEQNVGISLLVATDITDDGTVTLALNAQVSSILGFLQLNGGSYPQIATRESKSTLHLKDGQTMLMSGLLRDEEIVNLQKVPFLGQIPFFGELFKSRKTQKNSSQLLISITPHIIKQ